MKIGTYLKTITFSDGTTLELRSNTILLLTGPNNSGKSSTLAELSRQFNDRPRSVGPTINAITKALKGSTDTWIAYLKDNFEYDEEDDRIDVNGYNKYKLATIRNELDNGSIPSSIAGTFVAVLDVRSRLGGERRDRVEAAATILHNDEPREIEISKLFRAAFGTDLLLNRTSSGMIFHLGSRKALPEHADRLKPTFARWINQLPLVFEQGDGMRSFCRIMLEVLVEDSSLILIDEPEAFLHPPQVRHLAQLISRSTPRDTQLVIATHSDDFIRGLLDAASDRTVVARIERRGNINPTRVLQTDQIRTLWQDPLLRTSNILSALVHEVAIICEGDSDCRFFQSLLDETQTQKRLPDFRLFHCGGKDRIPHITTALRALDVPVIAIVDIDILSDTTKFRALFESLGGSYPKIDADVISISRGVKSRKARLTGRVFLSEVERICSGLEQQIVVPDSIGTQLQELLKEASPWLRIKQDGVRGLVDSTAFSAFKRISEESKKIGLLINPEGELEGFCRTLSRTNKREWLAQALQKDLVNDPDLAEARNFAADVRTLIQRVVR